MNAPTLSALVSVRILMLEPSRSRCILRSSQTKFSASQDDKEKSVEGDDISRNHGRNAVARIGSLEWTETGKTRYGGAHR